MKYFFVCVKQVGLLLSSSFFHILVSLLMMIHLQSSCRNIRFCGTFSLFKVFVLKQNLHRQLGWSFAISLLNRTVAIWRGFFQTNCTSLHVGVQVGAGNLKKLHYITITFSDATPFWKIHLVFFLPNMTFIISISLWISEV